MNPKQRLGLAALAAILAVPVPFSMSANAQSFSCAKAVKPAEMAICNDEDLLILDEQMASLFAENRLKASATGDRSAVVGEQNTWLRQRNRCNIDFTCLKKEYLRRIDVLDARL